MRSLFHFLLALASFGLTALAAEPSLRLPPRPPGAMTGSQFARHIEALSPPDREAAIVREISSGNIPEFLRPLKPIELAATDPQGKKHSGKCFVTADYLAVGANEDFFRAPMRPQAAQAIADLCSASLLTKKLSNDIFAQSELKLPPHPLTKDREKAVTFYEHHQIIEQQRQGHALGLLVAGIKKDVVLTNRLLERERRVAIYGWHYPDGKPIQPLYVGHSDSHVDYSHGIRLMSRQMIVAGKPMDAVEVLRDKELCALLSDEGPIDVRYQ